MNLKEEIFWYRVAIGVALRKLRESKSSVKEPFTQDKLNVDFYIVFGKTWNAGREEGYPNLTSENMYLITKYFGLTVEEFMKLVYAVTKDEMEEVLSKKVSLRKKLNIIKRG